jgi:hypothetical protein
MKKCSKCGEIKNESEFDKCNKVKCGYRNICKKCRKMERLEEDQIKWQKAYNIKRYQETKDIVKARAAKWQKENRERKNKNGSEWRYKNIEKCKLAEADRRKKNRELFNFRSLESIRKKPEHYKKRMRDYMAIPENGARHYFLHNGLDDPPQELIDLKAAQIRLFRAVRDKSMGVEDHGERKDGEGSGRDSLRAHRRGERPEVQAGDSGAGRDNLRADVPAPPAGGA